MEFALIVSFLPFVFLLPIGIQNMGKLGLSPIPNSYLILFVFIMAICMGLYPVEGSGDRERYAGMYMAIHNNMYWGEYKDGGWQLFVTFCTKVFGDRYQLFFLIVAFIYTSSYYIFAKHQFGAKYMGYFIIMAFGCLGFSGYGTNTIRSGMSVGVLLLSLSLHGKKFLKIFLAALSVTVHFSMIIPIGVYLVTTKIKSDRIAYIIWFTCFVLSVLNLDLSSLIEELMVVDQRVDTYANMIETEYNKGYRIDFLIYSVMPIIVSYHYKKKLGYAPSQLYTQLYRTYIITNGLWLLVIRMAYTNRIAYLSWMIIPFIVLYPIIENKKNIKNPQSAIFRVMSLFIGVSLLLSIRDLFFR